MLARLSTFFMSAPVVLVLGCGHQSTSITGGVVRGVVAEIQVNRFSLEVSHPSTDGGGSSLLPSGCTLRSGDQYSLRLTVAEPLYVYVEQHSSSVPVYRYPMVGQEAPQQSPRRVLLLPAEGFFRLDARPGLEAIYVVAARSPLSAEQLSVEIGQLAAQGIREVAETSNSRNRGEAIWGGLDGRGVGGLRFRIHHK